MKLMFSFMFLFSMAYTATVTAQSMIPTEAAQKIFKEANKRDIEANEAWLKAQPSSTKDYLRYSQQNDLTGQQDEFSQQSLNDCFVNESQTLISCPHGEFRKSSATIESSRTVIEKPSKSKLAIPSVESQVISR